MPTPTKQISPERRASYYAGMALAVVGFLLFASTFVTAVANFGGFDDLKSRAIASSLQLFGGWGLFVGGAVLMNIGAKGMAGAGIVLDPEAARRDVEPWSRMAGGIANDALAEIDVVKKFSEDREPQIKVRCRKCQALNGETAKYCDQCAAGL